MARPRGNPIFQDCAYQEEKLVMEGAQLKATLARLHGAYGPCHVDTLRCTFPRAQLLKTGEAWYSNERIQEFQAEQWDQLSHLTKTFARAFGWDSRKARELARHINAVPPELTEDLRSGNGIDGTASVFGGGSLLAARILGNKVVQLLGAGFVLDQVPLPGRDFYGFRLPIRLNDEEVGCVMGGTSSPNGGSADKQAETVHLLLAGQGCVHAAHAMPSISELGRMLNGWITRCDLAVDLFEGVPGGISSFQERYLSGEMDVRGRRPKHKIYGDVCAWRECTWYLGTRAAGKYSRFYQKGDQLIGVEANDQWFRGEVEFRRNNHILDWEMLTAPATYFAGASPFHAWFLSQAIEQSATVAPVDMQPAVSEIKPRAAIKTVEAEAERNVRWLERVVAPSLNQIVSAVGIGAVLKICQHAKTLRPGRLKGFSPDQLGQAFSTVADSLELTGGEFDLLNESQLIKVCDQIEAVWSEREAAAASARSFETAAEVL